MARDGVAVLLPLLRVDYSSSHRLCSYNSINFSLSQGLSDSAWFSRTMYSSLRNDMLALYLHCYLIFGESPWCQVRGWCRAASKEATLKRFESLRFSFGWPSGSVAEKQPCFKQQHGWPSLVPLARRSNHGMKADAEDTECGGIECSEVLIC